MAGHRPPHDPASGRVIKSLLDDIYKYGVLPQDFSIYLHATRR